MKKGCVALSVVLLFSLFLAACGGGAGGASAPVSAAPSPSATPPASSAAGSAASAGAVATVIPGKLVMATEATFPPYEYLSGTEIAGVDVDIAQAIADELGLELVIEEMPFDSVIAAVDSGKADFAAAGISVTPERQEVVDFSVEYATSMQVILTRDDSGVAGEADLAGKTVGVQLGTVADIVLSEDYPDVNLSQYNKYTDAVNDLISGRLDAIVLDSLPAEALRDMGEGLVICADELFTDVYAIAVKKGNDPLRLAIDAVLTRLMDEGAIDSFTQAHLS